MKLIIAGSRNRFVDLATLDTIIDGLGWEISEVVSGCCRGIDNCGEKWATAHAIPIKRFPALWDTYGVAAGPKRNTEMAAYGDALLAFPGIGKGTWDMISKMKQLMKPVSVWPNN